MRRKYYVGDILINNQEEKLKIIDYVDSKHIESKLNMKTLKI